MLEDLTPTLRSLPLRCPQLPVAPPSPPVHRWATVGGRATPGRHRHHEARTPASCPAGPCSRSLMDGLRGWALALALVGLVIGAAAWALGSHGQNYQQTFVGRRAVLISGLAALLIGAGPGIVNFFYNAGRASTEVAATVGLPAFPARPARRRGGPRPPPDWARCARWPAASPGGRPPPRWPGFGVGSVLDALGGWVAERGLVAAGPDRGGHRHRPRRRPRRLMVRRPLRDHGRAGRTW